jgi:3-phenylpropionate/cinnamic acid dioxygenase small subunit
MSDSAVDRPAEDLVADVLVRYATGIDGRDWDLLRSCFTTDCEADYGDIGSWHGADEITGWMRDVHEGCGYTLHRITNIAVQMIDGDHAEARCYVDALVLVADNQSGAQARGVYEDQLVRSGHEWRVRHRVYTMVHLQAVGEGVSL